MARVAVFATMGKRSLTLATAVITAVFLGGLRTQTAHAERPQPVRASGKAESVDPEARRLSAQGLQHFKAGEFDQALTAFKAAYARTPAADLLYNMAQAYRMLDNCSEALAAYRQYLDTNPRDTMRELAAARISDMQACVDSRQAAAGQPPQTDGPPPVAPVPAAPVEPTRAPLPELAAPARPADVQRQLGAQPQGLRTKTVAAIGLGAASGGLLALGGYFGWQARQASEDVSRVFDRARPWSGTAMADESRGMADQKRAVGFAIAGLVVGGVAAWIAMRR